ncbi:MAG TPA: hypothetical protein VGE41_11535 [Verrucomicrobiae bacterium]|jgi:hypothetical protein
MTAREQALKSQGYTLAEEGIPAPERRVVLVTRQFRCIGFLDRAQNWRYERDHGLVRDVIAWIPMEGFPQ